jgi:hypothetical protein
MASRAASRLPCRTWVSSGVGASARRALLGAALVVLLTSGLAPAEAGGEGPEGGLDARAWEMVSPPGKNGGQVGSPLDAGAASFQAAADGESLTYGSSASFAGGVGAPPVSQYLPSRGSGGWGTANVSPPLLSGTYPGGAYQLFAADLSRGLLSSGWACRDGGSGCAAENPPLDPGAPAGYRTLYRWQAGAYASLLTAANAPALAVAPENFHLKLAGATPDLQHAVISTCAALTADAVEVPGPSGCDPAATNLYRWSEGALTALNLLPSQPQTSPGADLAAPAGAISADGSRVYWRLGTDLYLREGAETKLVAAAASFQAASADGAVAFYLAAGHLHRFDALAGTSQDLAPADGVLGASASGSHLYYLTGSALFLRQGVATTPVAAVADPSNLPAATGTARVSADGTRLAFVSSASLTGYPNAGKAEVYLYEVPANRLRCVSCNPKGTPPLGPSTIPPARAAAEGPVAYKPRALSADGSRLFFDSADALVAQDTDSLADVYEWEAPGAGSCSQPGGCLGLISSGRSNADSFLDASADGRDAFFLTAASLDAADLGGLDVYDARAAGGFPDPGATVICEGDACQGIVLPPDDPAPGSATVQGLPNPPPRFVKEAKPSACKKGFVRKKGRCKKKRPKKAAEKHRPKRQGGQR